MAKGIGELNGKWSILFRVLLIVVPLYCTFFTAWAIWVTSETFANREFRLRGGRFTISDGKDSDSRHKAYVDAKVAALQATIVALPPQDWRNRILGIENKQDAIHDNQIRILSKLEHLQEQLEDRAVLGKIAGPETADFK